MKDMKGYGSLLIHRLLSWKILISTLQSPGKVVEKGIWKTVGTLKELDTPEIFLI